MSQGVKSYLEQQAEQHIFKTMADQEFTDAKAAVTQQAASGAAPPSSSGGKKVI